MAGVRGGDIACGITCRDRRTHITVSREYRTGNVHTPGFAIGIHRCLVRLGTHFNRNGVTRFDFITNFTRHRNGLTGLGRIDHVIAGDIIN